MLEISETALEYLAKEGYNPQYGARPLKRLIQNKILTPIAQLMVSQGVMDGGSIHVDIKDGMPTFDVKRKPTRSSRRLKTETPIATS